MAPYTRYKNGKETTSANGSLKSFLVQDSKHQQGDDNLISVLREMTTKIDKLSTDMKEVKQAIANIKTIAKEAVIEEISEREKKWDEDKKFILEKIESLEMLEESRKKGEIKNNVVIRGLKPSSGSHKDMILEYIQNSLGIEVRIVNVVCLSIKNDNLFVVKLASPDDKKKIMLNKKSLEGSGISITHDRTFKERLIQRKINSLAAEETKNGNSVQVGFKKLTVNGITKIWKNGIGLVDKESSLSQHPFRESGSPTHTDTYTQQ